MMTEPLVAAAVLALVMASCTSRPAGWKLNDELAVGAGTNDSYLPDTLKPGFSRRAVPAVLAGPDAGRPRPVVSRPVEVPQPSTTAIDRSNWEVIRVAVPNDPPAHRPIYTRSIFENDTLDRNRGAFPTALSSSQVDHPDSGDRQLLEAVEAPFAALADVVLFLPRAVVARPWQTVRSGTEPYRRAPNPRGSIPAVLVAPAPPAPGERHDPAAAPIQVPIGEHRPVAEPAPTTPPAPPADPNR